MAGSDGSATGRVTLKLGRSNSVGSDGSTRLPGPARARPTGRPLEATGSRAVP